MQCLYEDEWEVDTALRTKTPLAAFASMECSISLLYFRALLDVLRFTNKSRALKSELDRYLGRGKTRTENEVRTRESGALKMKKKGHFSSYIFLFPYLAVTYILLYRLQIFMFSKLFRNNECTQTCD